MIIIKKAFKAYKSSLILILSMIIGIILGLILKEKAICLEPLGNLFINLLSSLIVPILFTSIVLSIAKIDIKTTWKLIKTIVFVFAIYSFFAIIWGIFVTKSISIVSEKIVLNVAQDTAASNNIFKQFVDMLSVNDFSKLLNKENMIAIMVISFLTGLSLNRNQDTFLIKLLDSINNILFSLLKYIMYYAPIGICAYMAYNVGILGMEIVTSYFKVFIVYLVSSILFAAVFYSIIAKICKYPVKKFWQKVMPVIATSLSTCSSAATMPINIAAANELFDRPAINQATISLGTSFHKDGSVIDSVFKIMFLILLFNMKVSIIEVILVAIIATFLISAVPVGGGTISEMLIITLLHFPLSALPVLTIIATITDAPATMLNALGDTSAALLVNKKLKRDAI